MNIQKYIQIVEGSADPLILHNNANKATERIPVMKNLIAGELAKEAAEFYLSAGTISAHRKGELHFHDMDESPLLPFTNCCLVDLKGMLENGFKMGNADISTPKSIITATSVTSQIIAQVACHQYGGVSLNRLDEVLAPYVTATYEKHLAEGKRWMSNDKAVAFATEKTHKDTYDACQGLEYEVNTLFTSQGQTPFVTFGFGLGTSWQARLVQESLLKVRLEGLGEQKRTAIFPKLVYLLDSGVNMQPTDPNYSVRKLAIKCAARRTYPDIVSMPHLRANGSGCTPMGCRSFLHRWVDPATGEEVWDGRNNLGVVSVNLPRIALEVATLPDPLEVFFDVLDLRLASCRTALEERVDRLRGVKAKVAPIMYCEGALGYRLDPEDDIFQVFENGRASISLGYIGLHEVALALFGTSPLKQQEAQEFLQKVLSHMKQRTSEWSEESGLAYGLYSTPSESLCDRFCRLDKETFGEIPGITDKGYYTNSFHLSVDELVSPFTKVDFESPYHEIATSGKITFTELPNVEHHYREIMIDELWKYAATRVSYFGTNCVIDHCHSCHSDIEAIASEEGFACPICGNVDPTSLEVTKRVCGYLGSPNARPFIDGKQKEVQNRIKHK